MGQLTDLKHLRLECGGSIPDTGLLLSFFSLKKYEQLINIFKKYMFTRYKYRCSGQKY